MEDREIIIGLMLKLEEENVNCTKLIKRIGLEKYRKWGKAYDAAFEVLAETRTRILKENRYRIQKNK